jgi:hypothetical protein
MGNGVIGSPRGFGPRSPGPSPGSPANPRLRSSSGRASPRYGEDRQFESGRRLHVAVAQWSERDLAKVEAGSSRLLSHSKRWWRNGRRARLRSVCPSDVRVRVSPGARWRVNQPGCWASLLPSACLRAWLSISPLSAHWKVPQRVQNGPENRGGLTLKGSIPLPSSPSS